MFILALLSQFALAQQPIQVLEDTAFESTEYVVGENLRCHRVNRFGNEGLNDTLIVLEDTRYNTHLGNHLFKVEIEGDQGRTCDDVYKMKAEAGRTFGHIPVWVQRKVFISETRFDKRSLRERVTITFNEPSLKLSFTSERGKGLRD